MNILSVIDGSGMGVTFLRRFKLVADPGVVGTELFFAGWDHPRNSRSQYMAGMELWASDGTNPGTRLVSNIAPDSLARIRHSLPLDLREVGGTCTSARRTPA